MRSFGENPTTTTMAGEAGVRYTLLRPPSSSSAGLRVPSAQVSSYVQYEYVIYPGDFSFMQSFAHIKNTLKITNKWSWVRISRAVKTENHTILFQIPVLNIRNHAVLLCKIPLLFLLLQYQEPCHCHSFVNALHM